MPNPISHDQNFKNLILDYSQQALEFFAASEATHILIHKPVLRRFGKNN